MKTFKQFMLETDGQVDDIADDIDPTERVRRAINNLEKIDPAYFEKVFKQRSLKDSIAAGSVYDMTPGEIEAKLRSAEWDVYHHPSLKAGTEGFITYDMPGMLGIIDLMKALRHKEISINDKITLTDPKNTGKAFPTMSGTRGEKTDITVAILGNYPNKDVEVLFTFHPGEPADIGPDPSGLPAEMIGKVLTVGEALDMGIKMVKVV